MEANADYKRTYPISWEQLAPRFQGACLATAGYDYFKGIIAITRGGLVPAAILPANSISVWSIRCASHSYDWKDKTSEVEDAQRN